MRESRAHDQFRKTTHNGGYGADWRLLLITVRYRQQISDGRPVHGSPVRIILVAEQVSHRAVERERPFLRARTFVATDQKMTAARGLSTRAVAWFPVDGDCAG